MNQDEQMNALIGDKLLDVLLYKEMSKRMPNLSVSNIISIRHRLASNAYLAQVWDVMYRSDFIDNFTVHEKGTMIEMQLTKAEREGNQDFIKTVIKELLWYDVYLEFQEKRRIKTQNVETMTLESITTQNTYVQATVKTKTKENQTSLEKIIPKPIKHQSTQTIDRDQSLSSILNLFKKTK
jgi:hypothetical protein